MLPKILNQCTSFEFLQLGHTLPLSCGSLYVLQITRISTQTPNCELTFQAPVDYEWAKTNGHYLRSKQRSNILQGLNAFTATQREIGKNNLIGPLSGVTVAIKDNFCTRDFPTTCGSKMLKSFWPKYNATVVEKLMLSGALVLGKTNMDEFAMGSGTTDTCFGPVKNPWSFSESIRSVIDATSQYLDKNSESQFKKQFELSLQDNDKSWHICGGSSGGSAAAVAAGIVDVALGSDTGGSTRVPASHCGVVGLKPTYGRLSRHGLIPLVNSLDVPGILTNSVELAATVLNVLTGTDFQDSTSVLPYELDKVNLPTEPGLNGLIIGIPQEYYHPALHPSIKDAWLDMISQFKKSGATVVRVSLPHTRYSIVTYSVLCCCEVASNMARYDGLRFGHRDTEMDSTEAMYARSRSFGFNDVVRGRILAGNYFLARVNYKDYFLKAQKVRRLITEELFSVLAPGNVDILLTPTTPNSPITYKEFKETSSRAHSAEADIFTQAANLAGLPAVSVPVTLDPNGLPIGLQLIGQPFNEQTLLTVAKWMENVAKFPYLMFDEKK